MNNRTQNASYHTQRPVFVFVPRKLGFKFKLLVIHKLAVTVHTLHSGWGNFTLLTDELELVPRCERTLFCTVKLKQLREQTLIKTNLFWGKSEILSPADIVHWISKFVWFIHLTAFYQWLDFIQSPRVVDTLSCLRIWMQSNDCRNCSTPIPLSSRLCPVPLEMVVILVSQKST